MNIHKHARLTFSRRLEMVQQLVTQQCRTGEAAHTYGVTPCVAHLLQELKQQNETPPVTHQSQDKPECIG